MDRGTAEISYSVGDFFPLGAKRRGKDVNFAVSVPGAQKCVLKLKGDSLDTSVEMDESFRFGTVFAVKVKNLPKDFTYCYEAFGKEFSDPYAKSLKGREKFGIPAERTASALPSGSFDWKKDGHPGIPFEELIIYKLHVRGFTMDESSNVRHRGTFLGIAEKLPYLKKLGINAVLLMPCTEFDECMNDSAINVPVYTRDIMNKGSFHRERDMRPVRINYWGYGAESRLFAVKASYAADTAHPENEFKSLVRTLHGAGIEVLMELSLPERATAALVTDVCRYWVTEYHVDGFRFINMPVPDQVLSCDPYLENTKLIASCWDENRAYAPEEAPRHKHLGVADGEFEYAVRRFLKGDEGMAGAFAGSLSKNNRWSCPVNRITDTDGFTLKDLYSYDVKHNESNGENNRDGLEINYGWNCGKEGETAGKKVLLMRKRMMRNALIALFTAQGVPMLLAGDEFMNSQQGNNNAYCHDDSCGWLNWSSRGAARELTLFTAGLIALRKNNKVFRNPEVLRLMDYVSLGCPDLSYHGMKAWGPDFSYHSRNLGLLYNGGYAPARNGEPCDSYYVIFNMENSELGFDLPLIHKSMRWELVFSAAGTKEEGRVLDRHITLPPRCAVILKETGREME